MENQVFEICPKCNEEVCLTTRFEVQKCPACKEDIKPCSLCDNDTVNCNYCPMDFDFREIFKAEHGDTIYKLQYKDIHGEILEYLKEENIPIKSLSKADITKLLNSIKKLLDQMEWAEYVKIGIEDYEEQRRRTLSDEYDKWRKIANGFIKNEGKLSYDCGEAAVRENFSEFVGREISFEEMLELEKEWEEENNWENRRI